VRIYENEFSYNPNDGIICFAYNIRIGRTSTVPRHKEINDFLVKKICKDLGVNLR